MDLRDLPPLRESRGAWLGVLGILFLFLLASPTLVLAEVSKTSSAAPRQIFRPLPLDPVSVVWRAEARQEGMAFRLYREDQPGKLELLKQMPVELGRHDYRLKDHPQGERQRYVLRLVDAKGHESALRTIELVFYTALDRQAPLPPEGHATCLSIVDRAVLRPPSSTRPGATGEAFALLRARAFEPPDPPPDWVLRLACRSRVA